MSLYSTSISPPTSTSSTPSEKIKDYKSLHQRFANIIEEIEKDAPQIGEEFETSEEDSDSDPLLGTSLTTLQEIKILEREILQVQVDVKELTNLLYSKRSSDRQEVAKLTRQLNNLQDILKGQLIRAQRLRDKYEQI